MTDERLVRSATCLGCGCVCDDIDVRVHEGAIVAAERACERGRAWFGDGRAPARVLVDGQDALLDTAIDTAAAALGRAVRPLVYLAPELTCGAQRAAVALADLLRGTIDSVTSAAALRGVLAGQERGRASATLGEVRNRADVLLFWAVDPAVHAPRYWTRYAPEPSGLHIPDGRRSRTLVAVDVGASCGPEDADIRVAVDPDREVALLTALAAHARAVALERRFVPPEPMASTVAALLEPLRTARYVAIVCDGDAEAPPFGRDPSRVDGLITLGQALNAPVRCGLSVLRGGGNRSGADAVLTWQTGYPLAVDFARGYPSYRPHDGRAAVLLERGEIDVVLLVGALAGVPERVVSSMPASTALVIGPRATEAGIPSAVAIDTGVAGLHHGGMALRMDDVPIPLERVLDGPPATEAIVRALTERIVTTQGLCP